MKQMYILYIGIEKDLDIRSKEFASYLVRLLSIRYQVDLIGDLFNDQSQELRRCYDLIIVQNSFSFIYYKKLLKRYVKCPVMFVATTNKLNSYIAPFENLFGVLNMGETSLSAFGVPEEMQLHLNYPVEKVANYNYNEQQPKSCQIVYCPTGNSVLESDLKLLTFLQKTDTLLTIVSDEYQCLKNTLPSFVTIVPRESWFSVYKKAHLVVASGFEAVRAMALCKPCVILGDYGLGGLVTPENYNNLLSVSFRGRKGATFKEIVPMDLLDAEIRKAFDSKLEEPLVIIQKKVIADFNKTEFDKTCLARIEQIIKLSTLIKSQINKFSLKPQLSSLFRLKESEGKQYLMRGMNCFGEMEDEMIELLKQCDGATSIYDLVQRNDFDTEDTDILWDNLYELWKEKLILFKL